MTTRFRGLPVSQGRAVGVLRVRPGTSSPRSADNSNKRASADTGGATPEDVTKAFEAVAAQRSALAARLRAAGRDDEAGIIEVAALIAADPALSGAAADAVREGADPATAIGETAERHAKLMEKIDNPALAARAVDIRQVAAAAQDFFLTDSGASDVPSDSPGPPEGPFILVRRDISPAELIELTTESPSAGDAPLVGAVSLTGGASSHAAIIARGLGLPMIIATDQALLDVPAGTQGILDAHAGELTVGSEAFPAPAEAPLATPLTSPTPPAAAVMHGTSVTVLCNVASAVETRRGLAAGAEGVGLLRTEIPFLESADWPAHDAQRDRLAPILAQLSGKPAVVRLLDFSGDKIPPFLAPDLPSGAGLAALLDHPTALADQLRAVLEAGRDATLQILIPMVREPAEIGRVRDVLLHVAQDAGVQPPPVGIMVELAATAWRAVEFARAADFFSIGTNDLAGDVLGLSRTDPAAGPALAADPRVLDLVRRVADAGKQEGISVSVCGDAAADPRVLPLLIAAGIRVVSVAAGAVGTTRSVLGQGPS